MPTRGRGELGRCAGVIGRHCPGIPSARLHHSCLILGGGGIQAFAPTEPTAQIALLPPGSFLLPVQCNGLWRGEEGTRSASAQRGDKLRGEAWPNPQALILPQRVSSANARRASGSAGQAPHLPRRVHGGGRSSRFRRGPDPSKMAASGAHSAFGSGIVTVSDGSTSRAPRPPVERRTAACHSVT